MYVQKRVYTRSLCISLNAFHLFLLNLCIDFVSELYRIGDKVKFVGDPACSNYNRTKTEHTSHEALIKAVFLRICLKPIQGHPGLKYRILE